MTVTVTLSPNFSGELIGKSARQAQFAVAKALTLTAKDVKKGLVDELGRVLDRPTPYTLKSVFMKPATRDKPEALVWFKDDGSTSHAGTPATKYLMPHVEGGHRQLKRFERALQAAGHLPAGYYVVPGAGANLDQYGNISRGQIIQVLSQLRITQTAGYTRNMRFGKGGIAAQRRAGGRFFVIPPGQKAVAGVYQREFAGSNITPVMIFVKSPSYSRRFDFKGVSTRIVKERLPVHFRASLKAAMDTAFYREQTNLF